MTELGTVWSVVTVTHNSERKLAEFWSNVELPKAVEWIVVDNDSADRSAVVAERLGARVVRLENNVGFAAANNVGFDLCNGRYVAFVNPDVTPMLADLSTLSTEIDREPGLYAPQLVNRDGTVQANGRGTPYLTTKIRHRLGGGSLHGYTLAAQPGQRVHVQWLTGAVIASSREIFAALGPWDSCFFLYFEDCDLCLRAEGVGLGSYLLGDLRWVHGWAHDNAAWRRSPWRSEMASMTKFYRRYPRLITPVFDGQ